VGEVAALFSVPEKEANVKICANYCFCAREGKVGGQNKKTDLQTFPLGGGAPPLSAACRPEKKGKKECEQASLLSSRCSTPCGGKRATSDPDHETNSRSKGFLYPSPSSVSPEGGIGKLA